MGPISATTVLRCPTPVEGVTPPVTFLFVLGSMPQQSLYQRDVDTSGGKYVSPRALKRHLKNAIEALVIEPDRGRALEIVERLDDDGRLPVRAVPTTGDQAEPDEAATQAARDADREDITLYNQVTRVARAHWPEFIQAEADQEHWWRMSCYHLVRRFLVGLEGPAAPAFSATNGLVDEHVLNALGWARIRTAGVEIMNALRLSREEKKS